MAGAALAGRLPFGSVRSLLAPLTGGGTRPPVGLLADLLVVAVPVLVLAWVGQVAAVRSGVRFPVARPEQADDYEDPPTG